MIFYRNYINADPFDDPFDDEGDEKDKKGKRKKKEKKEPKEPKIIIPKVPYIEIEEVEELERIENEPNDSENGDEDEDEAEIIYEKKIYYEEVVNFIDLYSFLYKNGIIFLWENLTMEVANKIIKLIICLDIYGDATETASVLINCSKGSLLASRTLCNFMNEGSDINIETIGCGQVGGPGIYALLGGRTRLAFPNCSFLLSRPNIKLDPRLPPSEYEVDANIKLQICGSLQDIFTEKTGQPPEFIRDIGRRVRYMSAAEAREYGIIDEIIRGFNFKKPEDETQEKSDKNGE
uniref:ATP-dependent Clp protease proteolytic subunit n=1 Tax=Monotropa hypopitys TaxID=176248 RepID=A0A140G119_9ERIC|nr:Clp protease-Like protein [Monotropa hypopitys]AMM04614.1 Clp protease-Like protein [Monotropa hypopitys]ANP26269.1 ClpP [Monotropa hypopitys]